MTAHAIHHNAAVVISCAVTFFGANRSFGDELSETRIAQQSIAEAVKLPSVNLGEDSITTGVRLPDLILGESYAFLLPVYNNTRSTVLIEQLTTSCGCTGAVLEQRELARYRTAEILLSIRPKETGTFESKVKLLTDWGWRRIELNGLTLPSFQTDPEVLTIAPGGRKVEFHLQVNSDKGSINFPGYEWDVREGLFTLLIPGGRRVYRVPVESGGVVLGTLRIERAGVLEIRPPIARVVRRELKFYVRSVRPIPDSASAAVKIFANDKQIGGEVSVRRMNDWLQVSLRLENDNYPGERLAVHIGDEKGILYVRRDI